LKVTIIQGPYFEERIQGCYGIIAGIIQKRIEAAIMDGLTVEEFMEDFRKCRRRKMITL
jgi:hypothetical protein